MAAKSRTKKPPIAHGTMNIASWLPVNSWTRNVPLTDAIGRQTPRTPDTEPRWATGTWSGQHRHQGREQRVEEQLRDAPAHERRRGRSGATATTRTPSEPPSRPMTIHGRRMPHRHDVRSLSLPKNGLPSMASQGADPGDERQAVGRLVVAHQGVDLQRQGDQQGRDEHQAGAHERRRVQRDEPPADPADRAASGSDVT